MATLLTSVLQSSLPPGPQGATGPQGTNGSNGSQGATGAQGTNGSNGSQGATGAQGTNGSNGSQGATGIQGLTGPQGTNGSNGSQGTTGIQGTQGVQGRQGTSGPSNVISASSYSSGTYYPVLLSGTTPYTHTTTLSYASGTLSATDFAATSDARLKDITGYIHGAADKLDRITPVFYQWNGLAKSLGYDENRGDRDEVGLLAQEVQSVLPQAVYEDDNGYLKISYDRLIPLLIEALKDHSRQIKELRELLESK